jgi:hypothetical protein
MSESTITISFEGMDPDRAGLSAGQLRDAILEKAPAGVKVTLASSNPDSLQFGETIVIDLTAAVLVHAVVKAIEVFVLHSGSTIKILKRTVEGDAKKVEVVLDRVRPDSVEQLEKLLPQKKE